MPERLHVPGDTTHSGWHDHVLARRRTVPGAVTAIGVGALVLAAPGVAP